MTLVAAAGRVSEDGEAMPVIAETTSAGREMDALIAGQVFGKEFELVYPHSPELSDDVRIRSCGSDVPWLHCEPLPHYSTDIAAAWQIVAWFSRRWRFHLSDVGRWNETHFIVSFGQWSGEAETAPLAVCRAALVAMTK